MNERILIVDDELFVRELLQEMCGNLGYSSATIGSRSELAGILATGDFSAAIVDLRLKDCHGTDLISTLREMEPDLSIILMTGYPSTDDLIAAMRMGVSDCIVKPFRLREIEGTIARACAETCRKSEIRGLRERVSELEAKHSRRPARRLVMQREQEMIDTNETLEYVNRGLNGEARELSALSVGDDSRSDTGKQQHNSVTQSSPYAGTHG